MEKQKAEMIRNFNENPKMQELKAFYEEDSFMETLSVTRRETSHSSFLAWLFDLKGNHGLGDFSFRELLKIISRRNQDQNENHAEFSPELAAAILDSDTVISDFSIQKEAPANGIVGVLICCAVVLTMIGCQQAAPEKVEPKLKFAYITDTHLGAENDRLDTLFRKALRDAKSQDVDFVLMGGDYFHSDGCSIEEEQAVRANYERLLRMVDEEGVKAYYTPGNHDRYYFYKGEPSVVGHDMYKDIVGEDLYFSFDVNGIHFIVLNSTELTEGGEYYTISDEQIEWLKSDLENVGKEQPIVVSPHVPLMSLYHLAIEGAASPYSTIINAKEIVDILEPYNVKVVLQGHNHIHEEILIRDRWFVTGGATLGAWPSELGYVMVEVDNDDEFSWEYVQDFWKEKVENEIK